MVGKFVYSLNGSEYSGNFDTREAAEAAGLEAAKRRDPLPEAVYVGRAVALDSMACGHARAVLAHMAARASEQTADNRSSRYLAHISKAQLEELDTALENVILGWQAKHHLLPAGFKVEAISQLAVPNPPAKRSRGGDSEVFDLGVSETAGGN